MMKEPHMDRTPNRSIETLRHLIETCPSHGMVFFGGAGVSTESGIPDFRSPDGLYAQKYPYPPEQMISRNFFDAHPRTFFDFYCDHMITLDAQPNRAHRKLAELERSGVLSTVITQNIDGLHQKAGSRCVIELHGSALRSFCTHCHRPYEVHAMLAARAAERDGVPRCHVCGGIIKPDVVLYEEPLEDEVLERAVTAVAHADLMVVAGTSLAVYPAAGLLNYFQGSHLVIINRTPTPHDRQADLCITEDVGQAFDF